MKSAGGYTVVRKVTKNIDRTYIVKDITDKRLFLKCLAPYSDIPSNCTEIDVTMRLKHPGIMSCLSLEQSSSNFAGISLVFSTATSDLKYMVRNVNMTETERSLLVSKVFRALYYMHDNHILHLDIKPDNVIIVEGEPRLTDFGSSRYTPTLECILPPPIGCSAHVTPEFRPPEVIEYKINTYGWYTDVWSFAYLIFVIMTSMRLYPEAVECNNYSSIRLHVTTNMRDKEAVFKFLCGFVSVPFSNILVRMLSLKPSDRYSLTDINKSGVFGSVTDVDKRPLLMSKNNVKCVPLESAREMKKICKLFYMKMPNTPSYSLFLAIDLYMRCNELIYKSNNRVMTSKYIAAACIAVSLSSTYCYKDFDAMLVKRYAKISSDMLKKYVEEVIGHCEGTIHCTRIFPSSRGVEHLSYLARTYLMDSTKYITFDPVKERANVLYPLLPKLSTIRDLNLTVHK